IISSSPNSLEATSCDGSLASNCLISCIGGSSSSSSVSASTNTSSTGGGGLAEVLSTLDIPALLRSVNSLVKLVGVFCPPLSQVLDNVIQNVTSTAFRVFGRVLLRNGLGGSRGTSGGGGASRVNVVLPTYPPDEDDDYDDEDEEQTSPGADDNVDLRISQSTTASSLTVSPANDENTVAKRHVRVIREAEAEEEEDDQDGAESAPQPAEDLSNVDTDDTDRNKRYSPFGATVSAHGSTGGSGNFLFDIIRNTADRAARTVGTVYRMVAGTENVGWGLTTNSETSQTITSYGASPASSAK
ncbi:DNA-directed RNA polymerase I subunit rpa1, partial [Asbolus verrucosus]